MGVVTCLCLLVASLACSRALGLVPRRELGFVYKDGQPGAPVQVDLFVDLFCADSKAAFSALQQVVDGYKGHEVRLKTHLAPLPFHAFSFQASKTVHVVSELTGDRDTYTWMSAIFSSMSALKENAHRKSHHDVMKNFTHMVLALNVDVDDFSRLCCSDPRVEVDTRVAWKYACSRGVHTVPLFMINDMAVDAAAWTADRWKTELDGLLNTQQGWPLHLSNG